MGSSGLLAWIGLGLLSSVWRYLHVAGATIYDTGDVLGVYAVSGEVFDAVGTSSQIVESFMTGRSLNRLKAIRFLHLTT